MIRERFLVVGVFPAHIARVSQTSDPADLFSTWRRRHGSFVPAVGFQADIDGLLMALAPRIARLPATVPIGLAAEWFHRVPLDREVRRLCYSSIRQLGPRIAGPLLSEWGEAVRSATRHSGDGMPFVTGTA